MKKQHIVNMRSLSQESLENQSVHITTLTDKRRKSIMIISGIIKTFRKLKIEGSVCNLTKSTGKTPDLSLMVQWERLAPR